MITVTPFSELGTFNIDWLDAHYHFSFADYHDPGRMGLGPLRVWNDDTIAPQSGFEPHPHGDMEIITYVRTGAITHEDSLGNKGVTRAGDVQVMHAGTGIVHSETNLEDEPTTLFQIWIRPDRLGMAPGWQARQFPKAPATGALPVLASGRASEQNGHEGALPLYQDAAVLGGRIAPGDTLTHAMEPGRAAYLVVADGTVRINGTDVPARSGATITGETALTLAATDGEAEVVLVDVALAGSRA